MWLFLILTYVGFVQIYLSNPNAKFYDEFSTFYEICKFLGIILVGFESIYLIYYYLKFFLVYSSRIWRYKIFALASLFFLSIISFLVIDGALNVYSKNG